MADNSSTSGTVTDARLPGGDGALRTAADDPSRWLQTEKLAAIGQLAAGVAHEINNPIGYVRSNLNTIDDYRRDLTAVLQAYESMVRYLCESRTALQKDAAGRLESLERLKARVDLDAIMEDYPSVITESREGIDRVVRIVSDLKKFAHLDGEDRETADINAGIESTLNIVWNELKYKTRVVKDLKPLPPVMCYPQRLNQVFMNILVNAAQAIEDQGTIHITTRHEKDQAIITISDTGKGIPEEELPRIFEPFYTTKPVGRGTGLGLSVAYRIVKSHGGSIAVDSIPGKGTTFTISIPLNPAPDCLPAGSGTGSHP